MPQHHEWLINVEKSNSELGEATKQLQAILSELEKFGTISLVNNGQTHTLAPNGNVKYVIRYERHHNRQLGLKLELLWDESGDEAVENNFQIITR
jgi:hypothetical protein